MAAPLKNHGCHGTLLDNGTLCIQLDLPIEPFLQQEHD
jgi:hypothetical protein